MLDEEAQPSRCFFIIGRTQGHNIHLFTLYEDCMNCMLNTFSGLESVQEMMLPLIILILALIVLIALD
jgi:hypothetical protein